jgi:hypothetical protein
MAAATTLVRYRVNGGATREEEVTARLLSHGRRSGRSSAIVTGAGRSHAF